MGVPKNLIVKAIDAVEEVRDPIAPSLRLTSEADTGVVSLAPIIARWSAMQPGLARDDINVLVTLVTRQLERIEKLEGYLSLMQDQAEEVRELINTICRETGRPELPPRPRIMF